VNFLIGRERKGEIMTNKGPEKPEGPQQGSLWLNIAKVIFLVAVLVAAWFVLEWLIGGK
jgi:hypothetical protein